MSNISASTLVSSTSSSMQQENIALKDPNWIFMCDIRLLLLHNRALLHAKSFLYFMMPAQPPRRLRLAVQTSARFREAVLRSTQGRLYLHSALYRSRKIYLSAHLFSIDERPRVSEMKSSENFSRQQSRARK